MVYVSISVHVCKNAVGLLKTLAKFFRHNTLKKPDQLGSFSDNDINYNIITYKINHQCVKITDDDSRVKVMGGTTDFINASYIDVSMI